MERQLHFLDVDSKLEEEDVTFCFEGEHTFTCAEKKELVLQFTSAFTIAHSKLSKHVVGGAQPA